jgi:hypothetical protein
MAKLYIKKTITTQEMLPKKETVNFILNYSKALTVVKIGNTNQEFELNSN